METKEFAFKGQAINGFVMLTIDIIVLLAAIAGIVFGIIRLDEGTDGGGFLLGSGIEIGRAHV